MSEVDSILTKLKAPLIMTGIFYALLPKKRKPMGRFLV